MFDVVTALSTNFFRILIVKKFISIFMPEIVKDKKKVFISYFLLYITTTIVYLAFHFPPANIVTNLLMIYFVVRAYGGEQKKKILVTVLVYGINMICDILSIYSFSNYIVGENYNEIAAYITVLLISICEFITERYAIKNRNSFFTPPYWNVLIFIPSISIILLFIMLMNYLNRRLVLVSVSAGILFINMLIFYLYNILLDTYIKLEENVMFERQIASYSNQLDVLMQSEEKVSALRHDMKHHINELLIMADKNGNSEIADYLQSMQTYMENKREYLYSGNKEIDSILNFMLDKAKEVLGRVEYKINIPKELGVQVFDLNVIFGNLLENAIEAARLSHDKWLSIMIKYEKGMLFITIKNSYEGNLVKRKNDYLTTKTEEGKHGFGLQNVKRVISNYHGYMNIFDRDNVFCVEIMLYTLINEHIIHDC